MKASQIRAEARQMLSGKWGKGVKITLIYIICITLLSILEVVPITGAILLEILAVPIAYGIFATFCMLKKNEKVNITTFLESNVKSFPKITSNNNNLYSICYTISTINVQCFSKQYYKSNNIVRSY